LCGAGGVFWADHGVFGGGRVAGGKSGLGIENQCYDVICSGHLVWSPFLREGKLKVAATLG
jgi:hypothetical protein